MIKDNEQSEKKQQVNRASSVCYLGRFKIYWTNSPCSNCKKQMKRASSPYHCIEWTSRYIYIYIYIYKIITDLDSTPPTEHKYHFTTTKKHPHKWQSIYHILMVSLNNS